MNGEAILLDCVLYFIKLGYPVRTSLFVLSILVLATLAGCRSGATAAPITPSTTTQTPPLLGIAEPTLSSPTTITPTIENGFSIYPLAQDIRPEQLASLSHLELENQPLLSMEDMVSYTEATHEIELTAAGYERIHSLSVPTSGTAFAVCVNGEPVYAGVVIMIDPINTTAEHPVIQIQLGYPGADFFHGDDPRSDPRILQALEQAGKLK